MKLRIILISLLAAFVCPLGMHADEAYRPMLKDGKVWNCYYSNGFSRFKMVFYLDGDSIVDGVMACFLRKTGRCMR